MLNERAILAAKNIDVYDTNFTIQNGIPGEAITYKFIDTVMNPDEVVNYWIEFLNSLDLPGLSAHSLKTENWYTYHSSLKPAKYDDIWLFSEEVSEQL